MGWAPDVLEQLLLGNHPPRMPCELRQHCVFLAGQRDFGAVQQYATIGQVDRQRAKTQGGFLGLSRRCLAQQRTHTGKKLLDAERFGHVVIGATVEGLNLLTFAGPHRQHQHRHARPLAKLAQHLLAVHVGQAQVEHQQIRFAQGRLGQAFVAGAGFDYLIALGSQADAQEFADLGFVINDKNRRGLAHGVSSKPIKKLPLL